MKAKLLIIVSCLVMLSGCSTYSPCTGCEVGYWSTTCDIPNSGGASEAAFTDIAYDGTPGDCCTFGNHAACDSTCFKYGGDCSCSGGSSPNW
jgi:hypothetical protein